MITNTGNIRKLVNRTRSNLEKCVGPKKHAIFALKKHVEYESDENRTNDLYVTKETYLPHGELEKKFDRYLKDEEILTLGYAPIGEGEYDSIFNSVFWADEIETRLNNIWPSNFVFHLQRDIEHPFSGIFAKLLIPKSDFYHGLTEAESIDKYGEKIWEGMKKYLEGVQRTPDREGDLRILFEDLDTALKLSMEVN